MIRAIPSGYFLRYEKFLVTSKLAFGSVLGVTKNFLELLKNIEIRVAR